LKYVDFLFDSIEHQKLGIFKELDKSEILTKQQQNLVHYCSKGYKELEGRWVGFFVDNVPVVENWMLGMCDVADCINDVLIRSTDISSL
jgi:hypothetical protein